MRRDSVSKEAVHDIIGITKEGHKEGLSFAIYPIESASNYREILQDLKSRGLEDKEGHKEGLSFAIYPIESASNYREILQDLKSRGLEDIVLFVSDELTKLKHTLNDECPLSKHRSYWIHIIRNIANKVRVNNKSPLLEDLNFP
ncbi:TPA: hypothetical protein IUB97_002991 [Enterococcus faecalis]|nr:hypothetical protein [Enterococcus faecalis]